MTDTVQNKYFVIHENKMQMYSYVSLTHWGRVTHICVGKLTIIINKIPALVQIMAWRRPGDKPLSEPVLEFC